MKIPYVLNINADHIKYLSPGLPLPEGFKYPMSFAQERLYYHVPEIKLLSQRLNQRPFFVDLVQLHVYEPVYVPFDIQDKHLFIFFILKGRLLYTTSNYRPIVRTQPNTFSMSYSDTGSYFAYAGLGEHIVLVVSLLPEWVEGIYHNYHNLQGILQRFKDDKNIYDMMYQCRMDRKIHRWLYKIYSYTQANTGAIDGNLRKYISYLLEHYDSVLEDQKNDLAYKVKVYIEDHRCDNELNVKFLAAYFFVTERTLLNIFKRQYQMSVQDYITDLRMSQALQMMEEGLGIKDVYMEVGYADERTFRSALERYQKRR